MLKVLDGDDGQEEEEEEEDDEDEESEENEEDKEDEDEDETAKKKKTAKRNCGFDLSEGATVFVRNIPFNATEKDLIGALSQFGKIKFAKLVKNPDTGGHRGTGFVKFMDTEGAANALATEDNAQEKIKELL